MFLKTVIKELLIALRARNNFDAKLKISNFNHYLNNNRMREDLDLKGLKYSDEHIIYLLGTMQLYDWQFGLDWLDEDEDLTVIEYLNGVSRDVSYSQEIRNNVLNLLETIKNFYKHNNHSYDYIPPQNRSSSNINNPIKDLDVIEDYQTNNSRLNEVTEGSTPDLPNREEPISPGFFMHLVDYVCDNPGRILFAGVLTLALLAGIVGLTLGGLGIGVGLLTAAGTAVIGATLIGGSSLSFFGLGVYSLSYESKDHGDEYSESYSW